MPDFKKETLKEKKKALEAELSSIQNELDDSLDNIKSDVASSLDPLEYVRRHPLPVVGISVLIGFLAGKESGNEASSESSTSNAPGDKLSSTLWYEVKRLITRKGISFASDYIEDVFSGSD